MQILSGGLGFIGSHLCKALLDLHYVICVDNFYTGEKNNVTNLENKRFDYKT